MREPIAEDVRKIAVLRANALGDYIFCIPALEALKHRWPQAEVVYLGNAWHRDFLAARPGPVDRVVVVPRARGVPHETDVAEDPAAVAAFFTRMREESFDLALQMHGGGGNSNPFVRELGARFSVGLRADGAPSLDRDVPYVLYQNEIMRYLEVAAAAGAAPVSVVPRLALTARDRHELAQARPVPPRPYAVLHPGATDVRRRWPARKMGALADALAALNLDVYVTGVESERGTVDAVLRHARSAPVNLCGQLSLHALTALLANAELLVSNDTGPLHLARALGTRTVGIYWVGNMINASPPQADGHRVCMAWTTHCPRCGMDCIRNDAHVPRDGCDHAVSFLDGVSVAAVLEQTSALLGSSALQRAAV